MKRSKARNAFTRPTRNAQRRARLAVEALEVRCVLSTFTVSNTNDSGAGSLRDAVTQANSSAGPDTIDFSSLFNSAQTITLTSGELDLTDAATTTITGTGANLLSVSGNNASRVFVIAPGADAALSGLTVTGGRSTNSAGIYAIGGNLTADSIVVTGNHSTDFANGGGGIGIDTAVVTISNSAIVNNTSAGVGGGIFEYFGSDLTLVNCTLANNSAGDRGGGIEAYAPLTLVNCTVSNNSADWGGGIQNAVATTVTLSNTIVAGNTDSFGSPDVYGVTAWTSQGHNLIGKTDGSSGWVGSDLTGTVASPLNPQLSALADNGGSTLTMALLPNSPAINAGNSATAPATDQRGFTRFGNTDIGAYEYQFKVTTTADSGTGSLRQAIANANSAATADTVVFTSLFNTAQTITLTTGQLILTDSATTTITGKGANLLSVSGNNASRVFQVNAGATAAMSGLTITGGNSATGGGISNNGTLSLSNFIVSGNTASSGFGGGGIVNNGALTLTDGTISGNTAPNRGGGGFSNIYSAVATLTNITVSGNSSGSGGGVSDDGGNSGGPGLTLTMTNCTVSNNTATQFGGGGLFTIRGGTITLVNCTVSGNHSTSTIGSYGVGGVSQSILSTVTLANTIVAGNTATSAPGSDAGGTFISQGHNLIGKKDTSTGWVASDLTGTVASPLNAQLGALANNGGSTQTIALLPNSPAIGAGDVTFAPLTDQRGQTRFGGTDIGAYEYLFKVTNTTDNTSLGSLRRAITDANATPGADTVVFKIGTGQQTIATASALPTITQTIVIDGTTQTGFAGTPLIQIDGVGAGNVNGLTLGAGSSGSTIRGLIVSDFSSTGADGILMTGGTTNNVIQGNWIGLNSTGAAAAGNYNGIFLSSGNLIGTNGDGVNDTAERNVISGNLNNGVFANGGSNNKIAGNYIGTNVAGGAAVNNGAANVFITFADGNFVGTDGSNDAFNANERNVINGGVLVSRNTVVAGNYIGVNAAGTAALSAAVNLGIQFGNSTAGGRIGTNGDGIADAEERNVISGLNGTGIVTGGGGALVIAGNYIGANAAGTSAIPNQRGIQLVSSATGVRIGTNADGVNDAAEGNVVSGNAIAGVQISSTSNGNIVAGNLIGLNAAGTGALANGTGVLIDTGSSNNIVGGGGTGARNVISGNTIGVQIANGGSTGNKIQGNYIGTNAIATAAVPNDRGVLFDVGTSGNIVGTDGDGTSDATEGNLISGNAGAFGYGVQLSQSSNNFIAGNTIGTNAIGSAALANFFGIVVNFSSSNNRIGTDANGISDTLERNLISGNSNTGVSISASSSTIVAGNYIGTNATGASTIANGTGIAINAASSSITIGGAAPASRNLISGNLTNGVSIVSSTALVQGNTVAYNGAAGVRLASGNAVIRQNSMIGNTGLGIDVGPAGSTPNDSNDADGNLNAPVLTAAHLHGGVLEISGYARPGTAIEFYVAAPDATGFGEGTTYIGTAVEGAAQDTDPSSGSYNSPLRGLNVGSDFTTRFSFVVPVSASVTDASVITALALDTAGGANSGTSEFSGNISLTPGVVFGAPLVVAGADATIVEGATFAESGAFTDLDSDTWTATVDYGDGSGLQLLTLNPINYQSAGDGYTPTATGTFDLSHVYLHSGTFLVAVHVTDDAGNPGVGYAAVVVSSAPPQVDDSDITVSPTVVHEGQSVTVTGKFTDPTPVDHHTVMITWGDGSILPADSIDETHKTFTATHVYTDDKPKGTESDVYTLQVVITDSTLGVTHSTYGLFYVQVDNVRPSNLVLTPLPSTIAEGGVVSLGGSFSDPGVLDRHLVTIDWGDGSPRDVLPLGANILSFSGVTHPYLNNPAAPATTYAIQVNVTDDDEPLRPVSVNTSIRVTDVTASNLQLHVLPTPSAEGALTTLSGSFSDPGAQDRHQVTVNWGDGSAPSGLLLPAGATTFSGMLHTYANNPTGQPAGAFTVTMTVTDPAEPSAAPSVASQAITVLNVPPTFGPLALRRSDGSPLDPTALTGAAGQINENDEVRLTGSFTDPGRLDRQTVTIVWGDGTPATTATVLQATHTFQATHRFADNAVGTLVSLDTIGVTVADNDGGSTSSSIGLGIANVAPTVRILSAGGTTAGVTLRADAGDAGPIDAAGLTYHWTVAGSPLTGSGSTFTLPSPTAFQSYHVTLTATDNDGVFASTTIAVIVLDDADNVFEVPAQPAGVAAVAVFGLGGADEIAAGQISRDVNNQIIYDANGFPVTTNPLSIPVVLDGGAGQDTLVGGGGGDTIYLQQGNDRANGLGGNDAYLLKPNSTLSVVDGSGVNTLDFGLADFGSNVGVTFNLQLTSGQSQDVAPVGALAGLHFVSANDLGTGTFATLNGSAFDDNLTAASGATLSGGAGADTFRAVSTATSTITNAVFNGGADGDVLVTSGPNIGNLTFNGDVGSDTLNNLGTITGNLTFGGGADADSIINGATGVILGAPTFNGDDGALAVTNNGTIGGTPTFNGGADGDVVVTNTGTIGGTPTFNGGADGEVIVNQPGGVITGTPTFNGDDGVIVVTNNGTIGGTPTFNGGADADVFTNGAGGVISGSPVFNGDDGANTVTNNGTITGSPVFTGGADGDTFTNGAGGVISGSPVFTGGADGDIFTNMAGGVISGTPTFNGDDGANTVTNLGTISGTPTFNGGDDGDVFTNAPGGVISGGMVFNGDDGANTVTNFGTIGGSATFTGGADADVFANASGGVISGNPIFTGGADGDTFTNYAGASISGNPTFNGDDGADTVVNAGTIGGTGGGSLTFNGGADGDVILNPGTINGTLTFGGDDGADVFYNGATIGGTPVAGSVNTLTFNGDDGADAVLNPTSGTIGTLTFNGGADGDALANQGVVTGNVSFNGDDGANTLTNTGAIGGGVTFTGGADGDVLLNTGPAGSLTFNGDLGNDQFYNGQSGIAAVSFDAGPGDDLFINDGSLLGTVHYDGGMGNDVFGNTGGNLHAVTFLGDDGADAFINTGNTTAGSNTTLTFSGGAGDDTLINEGSAVGTGVLNVSFTGDDGANTLENSGSNLATLTFTGGADGDGFLNTGNNVASIHFTGDDGVDVLRNDGLNVGSLTFSGGADGDVLANYGTVTGPLNFNGDDGADSLRNSGVISGTTSFNGDAGADVLKNNAGGVISGSTTFTGGADGDSVVNRAGGVITGALTFNGDDGADTLGNAGIISGSATFNGGADGDTVLNFGAIGGSLTFGGDDGADAFYNGAIVNGVLVAGTVNTLTFNGDDGADVLANPAGGTITTATFNGGADGDTLGNSGTVAGGLVFNGDDGADVLVNQTGGVIQGPLNFGGGADGDVLYNQPGAVIGGGLTYNGDNGADSLANSGTIMGATTFGGGADGDTVTNFTGGVISGPLTFNGDDGADQLDNQPGATISGLTFNGGADGDTLSNQGTVSGNLGFNGDDGANTVIQGGTVTGGLFFNGGADGDTLTTQPGSTIGGSATFNGDDGANTLIIGGAITGPLTYNAGGDADAFVFASTGSAGPVVAHTGGGNDQFVLAGGGGSSFLLDGGVGDDTYTFTGSPHANVTIGEMDAGVADASSDTLDFSAFTAAALVLDLALTTPQVLSTNALTLNFSDPNGVENVVGTPLADTVYGNDRPNLLTGAALADDRMLAPSATPPQAYQAIDRTQWVLLDFDSQTESGEHIYTTDERAAIQARIESVYHGPDPLHPWFDVKFTQNPAAIPQALYAAGQYATLYFNQTPSFNRPGGEASEVDFGNTNLGGYASIQVNGLVGGEEQPAATSDDFVRLSAKIAAHETAHLLGVRHSDSFGPIGLGLHSPPGTDKFAPDYAGPAAAFETFDHLISSPATVGSDRFNDLRDLYFGPREAIKLTFAQSGVTLPEQSGAHRSIASAEPIGLYALNVPNTTTDGRDAGKTFQVAAVNVAGNLQIDPSTGRAESDYYAISGRKGDVLTLEVDSTLLARLSGQDTIDSVLSVYDAQGNLVPYYGGLAQNDDQFEPTDSLLLDLVLPADGTYYVQVASFSRDPSAPIYEPTNPASPLFSSNVDSPLNPLNPNFSQAALNAFLATRNGTDTGAYGLFIYRYSAADSSDQGDTLNGRAGNDTLRGGLGVDSLTGGAGLDVIDSGEGGPGYVVAVTPAITSYNNLFLGSASIQTTVAFADPSGSAFWDVTVDYGDGTVVNLPRLSTITSIPVAHTYTSPGQFTTVITVHDDDGLVGQDSISVTVSALRDVTFAPAPSGAGIYGGTSTLTATLTSQGAAVAGKTVTFTFNNGVTVTAVGAATTNANGVATLTGVNLTGIGAGTHVGFVGAAFAGDSTYHSGSASGDLVVGKATLTVTANNRSKIFGVVVTFAGTEFTASGLVYSDSVTTVTLSSPGAAASAVVGSYPITPSAAVGSGLGNYAITYTGGTLTVSTHAGSVYVLNPTASAALSLSGNASLSIIGDLVVDSSSSTAITVSGNASVSAASVQDGGGVSVSGSAHVTGPRGTPGSVADPYAGLVAPFASGSVLSVNLSGSSTQTISPGTYSSIKVSGNAKLTLNPGIYVIAGGGVSVSGNAGITGAGVTIYNAGSNILGGGTPTYGGVGLNGNGLVQLSAPSTGTYAGVLIFQSRDNTRAMSLSGNTALGITGMIYAPKALLSLTGNAQLQSHVPMVVDQLQLSGNGSSSLSTEADGIFAGELLAGDRSLYIDDSSGYLDASALARIDDAIAQLDALLAPYSVTVTLTSDMTTADLILDTATTSAAGGLADGVLGCYVSTGEITLIQGWNWYTGADPSSIAANQYDFETIVSHELGHALGLGHSADPTSTMFASLATQDTRRSLTTDDLGIRDADGGPDGLHADPSDLAETAVSSERDGLSTMSDAVDFALDRLYLAQPTAASSSASYASTPTSLAMTARPRQQRAEGRLLPAAAKAVSTGAAPTLARRQRRTKGSSVVSPAPRPEPVQSAHTSSAAGRNLWIQRISTQLNDVAHSVASDFPHDRNDGN
jgi:Matrixin/PKD domain/Right handed beta helix region/Periplasmic copper-binding protein (NosD)